MTCASTPSGRCRRLGPAAATLIVAALIAWGLAASRRQRHALQAVRFPPQIVMSTTVEITASTDRPDLAFQAMERALARMREVERLMNVHSPDSELSRVNRSAAAEPVPVSPLTAEVLRRALGFAETTSGAFDVTVYPLVQLWRSCAKAGRLPDEAEMREARDRVGWRRVNLDGLRVGLTRPGVQIDLGGIAKGFAVDLACRELRSRGFSDALVNAGGDLYAGGRRPDGRPWVIGIQDPRADKDAPESFVLRIALSDRAVATSGNYRRYTAIQGRRISHILDPRTGGPADAVPSVTIVAADCTTADALATGVSVLGLREGMKLVESLEGVEAMLITVEQDRLVFHRSSGFGAFEPPGDGPAPAPATSTP